jgi:hypothetical protein
MNDERDIRKAILLVKRQERRATLSIVGDAMALGK